MQKNDLILLVKGIRWLKEDHTFNNFFLILLKWKASIPAKKLVCHF